MPIHDLKHERRRLALILSTAPSSDERWRYFAKEFAYNLIGWMIKRGTSHEVLSQATGIHPATLTKIMRGNHNFGLDTAAWLAHALGTDVYSLFRKPRIAK